MSMDVEAEIREQVKGVHRDLLRFEARTEERFEGIDNKLREHDGRFDRLDRDVKGLRTDMPKIVADSMREVLREQKDKS